MAMFWLCLLASSAVAQNAQDALDTFLANPTISSLSRAAETCKNSSAQASFSKEMNDLIESFVMNYSGAVTDSANSGATPTSLHEETARYEPVARPNPLTSTPSVQYPSKTYSGAQYLGETADTIPLSTGESGIEISDSGIYYSDSADFQSPSVDLYSSNVYPSSDFAYSAYPNYGYVSAYTGLAEETNTEYGDNQYSAVQSPGIDATPSDAFSADSDTTSTIHKTIYVTKQRTSYETRDRSGSIEFSTSTSALKPTETNSESAHTSELLHPLSDLQGGSSLAARASSFLGNEQVKSLTSQLATETNPNSQQSISGEIDQLYSLFISYSTPDVDPTSSSPNNRFEPTTSFTPTNPAQKATKSVGRLTISSMAPKSLSALHVDSRLSSAISMPSSLARPLITSGSKKGKDYYPFSATTKSTETAETFNETETTDPRFESLSELYMTATETKVELSAMSAINYLYSTGHSQQVRSSVSSESAESGLIIETSQRDSRMMQVGTVTIGESGSSGGSIPTLTQGNQTTSSAGFADGSLNSTHSSPVQQPVAFISSTPDTTASLNSSVPTLPLFANSAYKTRILRLPLIVAVVSSFL